MVHRADGIGTECHGTAKGIKCLRMVKADEQYMSVC